MSGLSWLSASALQVNAANPHLHFGWESSILLRYIRSVYWALTTIVAIGYGDIVPVVWNERAFAMLVMIFGACLYSSFIANMTSIITNTNLARTSYNQQVADLLKYMRKNVKKTELLAEVNNYCVFMWSRQMSITQKPLFEQLPHTLQRNLLQQLLVGKLEKEPLLNGVPKVVIYTVVGNMTNRVYTPGENIYQVGEKPLAFYVIGCGEVFMEGPDGTKAVKRVSKRQHLKLESSKLKYVIKITDRLYL